MNKVLIITYHFPPDAAVGAIRPAKFAKYLPEFGWRPFVMTVRNKYYEKLDESKLGEFADETVIYRTSKLPNIRDIYLKLKFMVAKARGSERELVENILKDKPLAEKQTVRKGIRPTLSRVFSSMFVWLPDDKLGWSPVAVIRGCRIIKQEKIDAILTTSPPASAHLVGLILKMITGVKWVADFRDPWMIDFKKPLFARTALSDHAEYWMEKKVVEKADVVISATERSTQKFLSFYPGVEGNKFVTIWNGFERKDVKRVGGLTKYPKFTITYTGTFYIGRSPKGLLRAISELVTEKRIEAEDLAIQFIGNCRYADGESVEKMIGDFNLSDSVHIKEWMPYNQAVEEMAKSHVLLLLAPKQPLQIPGKVFEYLGLGANIIAILDDGATSDLLRNYKRAILVEDDDVKSLEEAILEFYQRYSNPKYQEPEVFVDAYERRFLTKKLTGVLDGLNAFK